MKKQEYAIVDIETTGGNASHSRITEIAILIHDGKKIIDHWVSLVNPEQDIPPAIFALTGITNDMVKDAPTFDFISDKVLAMLTDRIFVAHNVNFDYSFVRHQLQESGFTWTARKLCTVRAARKIKPGLPSYSLGKLCKSLDISLENAHRAGGDAKATAILFGKLLEWDTQYIMAKMVKNTAPDQRLPPNLPPKDFDQLPEKPGVYYFYNQDKKVIYVGKAKNLKKRVSAHFSGNSITPQRQYFLRDIYSISFEECGTEFMALLLECNEIKMLWPTYNRALKRFEPKFGLYEYEARNGYRYLAIVQLSKFQSCIESFNTLQDGIQLLQNLSKQFGIHHRFCNYGKVNDGEFLQISEPSEFPEIIEHNDRVQKALDFLVHNRANFVIVDKGRSNEERSCVWVENGQFYGMGYISSEIGLTNLSEIKDYIKPYRSNKYIMELINSFVALYPSKVQTFEKSYLDYK